jgi:hypothetical protein
VGDVFQDDGAVHAGRNFAAWESSTTAQRSVPRR